MKTLQKWRVLINEYILDPNGNFEDRAGNRYSQNPHYDEQYSINCATCSAAYALRRLGFDVTAKGNTPGTRNEWLSHAHSFDIWKVLQELVWVKHTANVGVGPVPARTPDRACVRRSPTTHIGPSVPSGWHGACSYTGGITHTKSRRTKFRMYLMPSIIEFIFCDKPY